MLSSPDGSCEQASKPFGRRSCTLTLRLYLEPLYVHLTDPVLRALEYGELIEREGTEEDLTSYLFFADKTNIVAPAVATDLPVIT